MSQRSTRVISLSPGDVHTLARIDLILMRREVYAVLHGEKGDIARVADLLDKALEDACEHDEADLRVEADERGYLYVICDQCPAEWYPARHTLPASMSSDRIADQTPETA